MSGLTHPMAVVALRSNGAASVAHATQLCSLAARPLPSHQKALLLVSFILV
jgi:hypothetical protein